MDLNTMVSNGSIQGGKINPKYYLIKFKNKEKHCDKIMFLKHYEICLLY